MCWNHLWIETHYGYSNNRFIMAILECHQRNTPWEGTLSSRSCTHFSLQSHPFIIFIPIPLVPFVPHQFSMEAHGTCHTCDTHHTHGLVDPGSAAEDLVHGEAHRLQQQTHLADERLRASTRCIQVDSQRESKAKADGKNERRWRINPPLALFFHSSRWFLSTPE